MFSAVVGRGVPHFHQHVFVRPVGVPDDVDWFASPHWVGAPRGDDRDVDELCGRLARHFPPYRRAT